MKNATVFFSCLIMIFALILCLGVQAYESTSECNYWYVKVPISVNHSVCSITEGGTIPLTCAIYYPCDFNISIDWYKSDRLSDEPTANGERISNLSSDKYRVRHPRLGRTTNNNNVVGCCFATSFLFILRFTHNDTGYYQCQIMSSNVLLQPSRYGHISPGVEMGNVGEQMCVQNDFIFNLNPPICAESAIQSVSSRVTCTNSRNTSLTTGAYSEITDPNSVTATSLSHTEDGTEVISKLARDATTTSKNSEITNGTDSQSTTATTGAYSEIVDLTSMTATATAISQNEGSDEGISRGSVTTLKNSEVTNGNQGMYGTTLRNTETTEENMWVYGTIVGAVVSITLVVIVFVMGVSIVCCRCRTKRGMDGNSRCHWKVTTAHPAEQEVRNLHYIKTILTDTNKENVSECRESHIIVDGSKVNTDLGASEQDLNCEAAYRNATHHSLITDVDSNTTDKVSTVDPNQVSINFTSNQSEYAAINKANKKSESLTYGKQITMISSPDYAEVADSLQRSNYKLAVNVGKLEDVEPLNISQSPLHVYAEVSKNKEKQKPQSNMEGQRSINSAVIGHQRSPSPEYAMVENTKELSRDLLVASQEEEDFQHYYHTLDNQITDAESRAPPKCAAADSIKKYCKDHEEEDQPYYHSLENLRDDNIVTDGTGNEQKCMAMMNSTED